MLLAKFVLRKIYKFSEISIDPSSVSLKMTAIPQINQTQNPHDLDPKEVINKLSKIAATVTEKGFHKNIRYLSSYRYVCFILQDYPGIVFKTFGSIEPLANHSAEDLRKGNHIFLDYLEDHKQLHDHLNKSSYQNIFVSKYKLFEVKHPNGNQIFIAEEAFPIYSNEDSPVVWRIQDKSLQKAVQEFAYLIEDTGGINVSSFNCFPFEKNGNWHLALIGGALFPQIRKHLIKNSLADLIYQVYSRENMQVILDSVSKEYHPFLIKEIIKRQHTVAVSISHEQFHKDHSVYEPTQLLINANDLSSEFDLEEEGPLTIFHESVEKNITMAIAIDSVIKKMNTLLKKDSVFSNKEQHFIFLNPETVLSNKGFGDLRSSSSSPNDPNNLWIRRILSVLLRKNLIHSWCPPIKNNIGRNRTYKIMV